MEHEVNEYCKDRFDRLESRAGKSDDVAIEQGKDLIEVKTEVKNLTHSLNGLTNAIWGMSGSIFLVLLGFFVWFVQTNK